MALAEMTDLHGSKVHRPWRQTSWVQVPSLLLAGCVALGKVLNLSFLTLNGHDPNTHLTLSL